MTNSKGLIFALVFLVAGSIVLATLPRGKTPKPNPPNSKPVLPTNDPFGNAKFKSLVGLLFFPTAPPTPTSPPIPETPTPSITLRASPTPTSPAGINTPTPTPGGGGGACAAMDNGLPNAPIIFPNGSSSMPSTTKEVCAWNRTLYYSLPYRNKNCTATQAAIDWAYGKIQFFYPIGWPRTKLKQDWQTVQEYALKYNFNPIFVIALWIEESAAGGYDTPPLDAWQLGCRYRINKDGSPPTELPKSSDICEQMECLFGRGSVDPTKFAFFACNYRYGANEWQSNRCLSAINFTINLDYWYGELATRSNAASGCYIRYSSPADSRCAGF